ncbi:non-ribosomal peptide synthetase [Phytohabitans suffuscus]|uniref:Phenyloxazoline synthase MbtB n=1 Tax=Phytohabitans suffuscus TaxID=624315 RepID=A0A6F8YEX0_9ACTN|nr:non-ribosomal peptide synthetase [Phytohabitans suffuscus]BCB84573.1 hypothetical protein Psuf_018860 [Phytohabitans suffuscus]
MASEDLLRDYLKRVTAELQETRRALRRLEEAGAEPVAIVGMGCRLPGGAGSPEQFWNLLVAGRDAVSPFPLDRGWPSGPLPGGVGEGGFLHDGADFDAAPFGVRGAEALAMDPQHRLLLETAWEAIERARIDPASLAGSRTGVYVGLTQGGYADASAASAPPETVPHLAAGTVANTAAGRISHTLDLAGPALTIDTACSSSLVALHVAARALRGGECDLALVGGAAFMSRPDAFTEFARREGLAADGRCKAFAAAADGMGFAEGAAMLVLQTLSAARRHGRPVLALIAGTAVGHDGATNGLGAPSGPAQRRVIAAALADARLRPDQVDAVEAHGTGTSLGDAVEAAALIEAYGTGRERPLLVGTVKSNIGHTQAAAGVAAVVKTVQAIRHSWLPRTLHADQPTPHVRWDTGAVRLLTEPAPWPRTGEPHRAGVSAFGASGTGAHVILTAAAAEEPAEPAPPAGWTVWVLSGPDEDAVRARARQLAAYLDEQPDLPAAALGAALATTRTAFRVRSAVVGSTPADLRAGVDRVAGDAPLGLVVRPAATVTAPAELLALAERWVSGEQVVWGGTFGGARPADLPTYPFQRRRLWLPGSPGADPTWPVTDPAGETDLLLTAAVELRDLLGRDEQAATGRIQGDLLRVAGRLLDLPAGDLPAEARVAETRMPDLGLDSVRGVRLRGHLAAHWQVDVPLEQLLGRATLAELATAVAGQLATRADLPAEVPLPVLPDLARRYEPFPLTDVQHAYWVGRGTSVELGGIATTFYLEFERESLDVERLERALGQVIVRHEMLRAVVTPDGRQRILADPPPYRIEVRELAGGPAGEPLARLREEMLRRLRPADEWPLFDVRVSVTGAPGGASRARLHLAVDMLILDGASVMVVLADWQRYYQDPAWAPEPLTLSFRDVVLAEAARSATPAGRKAEEYWLSRIDSLPPPPALPLAAAPAQLTRPEFVRRHEVLDTPVWAGLTAIARRRGLTPSVVLMTAFTDVLRRWTHQPAMTLNLTLFNRPVAHPHADAIAGDFTSLTMLAAEAEPGDDFARRAERLQAQLLRDLEHASFNGVKVLRERARRSGRAGGALMPVVFTSLLGIGGDTGSLAEHFGEVVHADSQTPQVWLDHVVTEDRGRLTLNWYAAEALFPAGMLDDMFAEYLRVLRRLGDEHVWSVPGSVAEMPRPQAEERVAANRTAAPIPATTLYHLVRDQAERAPDAPAVIAGDGQLTYGQLLARAHRIGRALTSLGAIPGELVGVLLPKGCEQVAAVLGVAASGAAYLPIDLSLPEARRAYLLAQCRTGLVITDDRLRAELSWPPRIRPLTWSSPEVRQAGAEPPARPPAPEDLAYVIFTSGSTGLPKGVVIDHRGAANTVQDINARVRVAASDRVLGLSSLGFDLSVYDVFGLLAAGGAVVLPTPGSEHDPRHWADLVARHEVTVWNSVPALLQAFVDSRPAPQRLRLALLSGDWIPVSLPDAFRRLSPGAEVISLGGATEASIWSVTYPIGEVPAAWTRVPYGKPLANQTMHVLDEQLADCPVWSVGEIYIGGVGVALGYWDDPVQTDHRFVTHPATGERLYRTGDLGRYLPGGDIDLLGRSDFQVKLNGYRIELDEIAAALRSQDGVHEALVNLVTNEQTGRRALAAYVIATPGAEPAADDLRRGVAEILPEYMVPHHYVLIDHLPLSANGKVDRGRLPSPWDDQGGGARTAPEDDLEKALHRIWQDVLGHADFGVTDDFFELGGDSLHAVQILTRVREELAARPGGDGGLELLYDNPTVARLAAAVRGLA